MRSLLFGHDETVAEWVAKQAGARSFVQPFTAFGLVHDGHLVGGFVFTGFNGHNIELSIAGKQSVSRSAIRALLNYVFEQLKCSRLQVHTRRKHKRVCRLLHRSGFKYEGVARRYYGRDDAACYALTADDLPDFKTRWKL